MTLKSKSKKDITKGAIIIALCIAIYLIAISLPTPDGLTLEGQKAIALMIISVIIWVTEVIPIGISSVFLIVLPSLMGIEAMGQTLSSFWIPTVIFIFSASIIVLALVNTGLDRRIFLIMSSKFGNKPKQVLLSFMLPAALLSMFLLNIPTAMMFGGIALGLLHSNQCVPGKSNFGKSLMIGIPVAATIGGIGAPSGSGINIFSIGIIEQTTGTYVDFLKWTIVGVPMMLVVLFAAWIIISKVYPAEMEVVASLDNVKQELHELGPMDKWERKFAIIFGLTILSWLISPFTGIDATVTSITCAAVLFIPGIDLVDWGEARTKIGWDSLLLVGASNSLAMTLITTNASEWIARTFLSGFMQNHIVIILAAISLLTVLMHFLVPISNAVVAVLVPIVVVLANEAGLNPVYLTLPIAFMAANAFLLPLDPTFMTTYQHKYWSFGDVIKPGIPITIVWIAVTVVTMMITQSINFF